MRIGRISIKVDATWCLPSLLRRFLDCLVIYFGEPICGWTPLNYAYVLDNNITYFVSSKNRGV
jgi:hypothetical protein